MVEAIIIIAALAIVWELRRVNRELVEVGTLLADVLEVINNKS